MKNRTDLTRWNRAARSRFRYVDGQAAEYLEILRQQLVEKFRDPENGRCEWLSPAETIPPDEAAGPSETLIQRQQRLRRKQARILQTYHQDRRDWAWEITRTFARACHILTEHANANANEGYLGTATQWENVRRLVEMLDYHPAPPASAIVQFVVFAKEKRKGILPKGFQVKNTPAQGEAKVLFETLEDKFIDPALNAMRPKGWNRSEAPAVRPPDPRADSEPLQEQRFSILAEGPASQINGVGQASVDKLKAWTGNDRLKIKDFPDLDPQGLLRNFAARVWEWKAKADVLINFAPQGDWSAIADMRLPHIAAKRADKLAELSGNAVHLAKALKLDIAMVEICLTQNVYERTHLADLFAPPPPVGDTLRTAWRAESKPKVVAEDVVMIHRTYEDPETGNPTEDAQAATVAEIDKDTRAIHLTPSPVQHAWPAWKRSELRLMVAPRWKAKCWLNGRRVVRTKEAHGLTQGAYIGWKKSGVWQYAEVTETDRRNLRLEYEYTLPDEHTELFQLLPIKDDIVSKDYDVIVLLAGEDEGSDVLDPVDDVFPGTGDSPFDKIFTINESVTEDIASLTLLPPASLPGLGSFLFPTPFLPMDLVKAAIELMLNLGVMQIPSTGEVVIKGLPFEGELADVSGAQGLFEFLKDLVPPDIDGEDMSEEKMIQWDASLVTDQDKIEALEDVLEKAEGGSSALFQKIEESISRKGPMLAVPEDASPIAVVDRPAPRYVVDGSADKISGGDWLVGVFSDGMRAMQVDAVGRMTGVDPGSSHFFRFNNLNGNIGELQSLHADFRGHLISENADINQTQVSPEGIELEEPVPESLNVGDTVLLTAEDKEPFAATVERIDGRTLVTRPPAADFTKGELIVRGNVVTAGHGEGKPEKNLGSGDAVRSNQEFTLRVDHPSFIPDATQPNGVAAAVTVAVAGRVWEQVASLRDSTHGDHHYAIRMTEEGHVKIIFGDGQNGRRLPSGKNNVRVRYRVGSGVAGNLPPGSLEKPVKTHPLVKAVHQPFHSAGGADMEDVASLKENAPASLLALGRAVSLSDFSHLAAAQSSVWQAKAFSQVRHGGRTESVKVVIVPAGGVASPELNAAITAFLQKHALPGVHVTVHTFVNSPFTLAVTLKVDTDAFLAEQVEKAVAAALVKHFTLRKRRLGEHLYLSEVYKIVEDTPGVTSSLCVLDNDKTLQLIRAANPSTVVCLDMDGGSTLTVRSEDQLP